MSASGWMLAIALCAQPSLPGFLDGVRSAAARAARRLWEREEPNAARGNALAAGGEVEKALGAYDAAEKTLPAEGPAAGALAHDRASARLKQGAEEAPRALADANRALSSRDPATRALGAYDAALALEGVGNAEQAIGAYGRALALDPGDADSKVNLELLLREEERRKKQPGSPSAREDQKQQKPGDDQKQAQGKQPDQKPPNENEQRQARNEPQGSEKQGSEKQGEEKQKDQTPGEQRPSEGSPAGQEPRPQGEKPESMAQASAQPLDRSEAQRLLDALRGSEKNLQIWRFGKRSRDPRRKEAVKDW